MGAACTQVFEKWEQSGLLKEISETSARLLMCGILDNTLNFGADITTERDHHAYGMLKKYANLPEDWPARYFRDCQKVILQNLSASLKHDTKTPHYKLTGMPRPLGSLLFGMQKMSYHNLKIFLNKSLVPKNNIGL